MHPSAFPPTAATTWTWSPLQAREAKLLGRVEGLQAENGQLAVRGLVRLALARACLRAVDEEREALAAQLAELTCGFGGLLGSAGRSPAGSRLVVSPGALGVGVGSSSAADRSGGTSPTVAAASSGCSSGGTGVAGGQQEHVRDLEAYKRQVGACVVAWA